MDVNRQIAPYPTALAEMVEKATYRRGWSVHLHDDYVRDPADTHGAESRGLSLVITTNTVNSYHHDKFIAVRHLFAVPPATYDARSWRRWLFERFRDVESHECAEFFTIDGVKPYAPSHGPGNDPYLVREVGTDVDRETSFRGEINK